MPSCPCSGRTADGAALKGGVLPCTFVLNRMSKRYRRLSQDSEENLMLKYVPSPYNLARDIVRALSCHPPAAAQAGR